MTDMIFQELWCLEVLIIYFLTSNNLIKVYKKKKIINNGL